MIRNAKTAKENKTYKIFRERVDLLILTQFHGIHYQIANTYGN